MAKHKEKPRFSKLVVTACLILCVAYTVTCFVFIWNGKPLNDVQTLCFYGCFGIEFASLAFITRGEYKYVGGNQTTKQMPHVEVIEKTEGEGNGEVSKPKVSD